MEKQQSTKSELERLAEAVKSARAAYEHAKGRINDEWARMTVVAKQGHWCFVNQPDWESLRADRESARARLVAANQRLEEHRARLAAEMARARQEAKRARQKKEQAARERERAAERARQAAEQAARERERALITRKLQEAFDKDFLGTDAKAMRLILREEPLELALTERDRFIHRWWKPYDKVGIDQRQARAIASVHDHTLVTARAGSGKTRTIIARTAFLVHHCNVPTSKMLLLAFNKKAAKEVKDRLEP